VSTWIERAQRLQLIAQAGLTYSKDPFDRERFEQIREVAADILAEGTGAPVERTLAMLKAEEGYATPKVDVRTAVFRAGQILLVREASDGHWSLPGGWADLGESAAAVAVREVKEESGYDVRVTKVLAVLDKSRHGAPASIWHAYMIVFRGELVGEVPHAGRTAHEITEVGWFSRDALPPLSLNRNTPAVLEKLFEHADDPSLHADFD
jgi:ADP-ribose pyrophosphatase YjhB (NUDIX family)